MNDARPALKTTKVQALGGSCARPFTKHGKEAPSRLRVLERSDQPSGALEFFWRAEGRIAEREALDADGDIVLQDLGGLVRSGRLEHDPPFGRHPFHHALGLSFVLHQD